MMLLTKDRRSFGDDALYPVVVKGRVLTRDLGYVSDIEHSEYIEQLIENGMNSRPPQSVHAALVADDICQSNVSSKDLAPGLASCYHQNWEFLNTQVPGVVIAAEKFKLTLPCETQVLEAHRSSRTTEVLICPISIQYVKSLIPEVT